MSVRASVPRRVALVMALAAIGALPGSQAGVDGRSRLRAVEPLGLLDGAVCEVPVSISHREMAAEVEYLRQQAAHAAAAQPAPDDPRRAEVAKRQPVRTIRDRFALYSAVAVDVARNEVILQDANLFRVLVYDRDAKTPATAEQTTPKRIIEGPLTHLEFNNSVYVDPKTGNVYAVNNDTEDHLVVFDRQAKGNVAPNWKLHIPHGAYGIAVDEARQEMFLTIQHSNAVSVFSKSAKHEDAPVRLLQGDRTLLADPHGVGFDSKTGRIFVTNFGATATPRTESGPGYGGKGGFVRYNRTGIDPLTKKFWPLDPGQMVPGSGRTMPPSITVYPHDAHGDVAPIQVIQGPATQLNWPAGVTVDAERGEVYVANDGDDSVLVFSVSAHGNAAPIRVLKGPRTGLKYPNGVFIDFTHDELWVANFGNHKATAYKRTASGDTPPIRVIRSAPDKMPAPLLVNARIAYDTTREEILAPNCVAHPQIAAFDRLAEGNAEATRRIEGQKTLLGRTMHAIFYDALHDEIIVPNAFSYSILTFRGGANGEEAPIRVIQGPLTGLVDPDELDVDPVHNEIFVPVRAAEGGWVHVFPREAVGNVAPIRKLGGPATGIGRRGGGFEVTVDPTNDLLYVTGGGGLRVFNRTDSGNVAPKRFITGGPISGTTGPGTAAVYAPSGMIVATTRRFGARPARSFPTSNFQDPSEAESFIAAWHVEDNGDVRPRWTIAHNILKEVRGVALDPKNKTVMVIDKGLNAVMSYHFPEVFEPRATTTPSSPSGEKQ